MPLSVSSNRIIVRDVDNRLAFDTDWKSFHQLAYHSGVISVPQRSCIDVEIDDTRTIYIGACPAVANAIMGSCFIQRTGYFPSGAFEVAPLNVWINLGGTIDLTVARGQALLTGGVLETGEADSSIIVGIQQLTFEIIGAGIYATERVKYLKTRSAGLLQSTFGGSPSYSVTYHVFAMACDI